MRITHNIKRIFNNQIGFTAVELLIGIALIGIIGGAIGTTVAQTFSGSSLSANQMTAINNIKNAVDWITRDAQMARPGDSRVVPVGTGNGVPVVLGAGDTIDFIWYVYEPNYPTKEWHRSRYVLASGNVSRAEDIGSFSAGVFTVSSAGQTIIIAQNITGITRQFDKCVMSVTIPPTCEREINTITITISSTAGSGNYVANETRTFEIKMRPTN